MKLTRKDFLRILTGTAVAAGAGTLVHAVGSDGTETSNRTATGKQRWAMVIDLQKCRRETGCTKCSAACHRAHNVPQMPDTAREVKWIWNERREHVFPYQESKYTRQTLPETLPILCNHCADPACVRVCPTKATWKREDGVVMMDYHRCIGCRYCMAACPYGSRSFNYLDPRPYVGTVNPDFPTRTAGVVEKCNFCEELLAQGRLPACVEACPQKAMLFGDLNDENSSVRQVLGARFAVQRKPELGCGPSIFYLV